MPMNYIDPMEIYRSKPDIGGSIANGIKGVGNAVAGIFAQLPEAKRRDAEAMDDRQFKEQMVATAKAALQKIGVDPNTVQMPSTEDQRLDKQSFAEQIGNVLAPYAEGEGDTIKPEVLDALGVSQNPNIQESVRKQQILTQYDPMSRLDFSKMQTVQPSSKPPEEQQFGPALAEGTQSTYDPITGQGMDAGSGQINQAPQSKPMNTDNLLEMAMPALVESLKRGDISSDKFSEKLLDLKLADKKLEMEEKRSQREAWREMVNRGVSAGRKTIDPETNESVTLTKDNYEDIGLGDTIEKAGGIGAYSMMKRADWVRIHGREPQTPEEWYEVFQTNLSDSGISRSGKKSYVDSQSREVGGAAGETASNVNAIPGLQPIPGIRITDQSVKAIKDVDPDIKSMNTMIDAIINKYETMGSVFTGDDAADYSSKVRSLQLLAKSPSLYNLGVLTGSDLRLLEESIPNPASIKEGVKKQVLGDLSVRLKNFKDLLNTRKNMIYRVNGFEEVQQRPIPQPAPAQQPPATPKRKRYNPQTGTFEVVE